MPAAFRSSALVRVPHAALFVGAMGSSLVACASGRGAGAGATEPAAAKTEILQTATLVMRGTAPATMPMASCTGPLPPAEHRLMLTHKESGRILLRQAIGEKPLQLAVLHVTHLDSKKSWCVTSPSDGAPAVIPAEFADGTYAITVAGWESAGPQRYEVVFEKL